MSEKRRCPRTVVFCPAAFGRLIGSADGVSVDDDQTTPSPLVNAKVDEQQGKTEPCAGSERTPGGVTVLRSVVNQPSEQEEQGGGGDPVPFEHETDGREERRHSHRAGDYFAGGRILLTRKQLGESESAGNCGGREPSESAPLSAIPAIARLPHVLVRHASWAGMVPTHIAISTGDCKPGSGIPRIWAYKFSDRLRIKRA